MGLLLVVAMAVLCITEAKKKKSDYAPGECHKSVKNCRYCAPGHERLCQICELGYSHQKTAIQGRKYQWEELEENVANAQQTFVQMRQSYSPLDPWRSEVSSGIHHHYFLNQILQ